MCSGDGWEGGFAVVPKDLYLEYLFLWTALADVHALKRDTLPMENTPRICAEQLSSK